MFRTKEEIFIAIDKFADRFNIDKKDIVISGGSALLVQGLRESTNDIDVLISPKIVFGYFRVLLENINPPTIFADPDVGECEVFKLIDIEIVAKDAVPESVIDIDGYRCASLEYVLRFKEFMNRGKDRVDIMRIREHLNKTQQTYTSW